MRSLLFMSFLLLSQMLTAQNKLIYIVSEPRSISTAMFRMFANRSDFVAFHEPTIGVYAKKHTPKEGASGMRSEDWIRDDAFASYEEMESKIMEALDNSHVVVKDISFSTIDYLLDNHTMMKNPQVHFIFLVRGPEDVLRSFYKQFGECIKELDIITGTKQLYTLYEKVKSISPNQVQVVFSKQFLKDPKEGTKELFANIDLPLTEESLKWESLGEDFDGTLWHEQKRLFVFQQWHRDALKSTHIFPKNKAPSSTLPFADIEDEEQRRKLLEIYENHLPYYEMMIHGQRLKDKHTAQKEES